MPKSVKEKIRTIKPLSRIAVMRKGQAQKFLMKVPEENVFRTQDGLTLRDMKDLKDALVSMTDQTFAHHSNEIKRDFSNWVRDIIGDEKLAKDLETATNREQAAHIVEERYNFLVSKSK